MHRTTLAAAAVTLLVTACGGAAAPPADDGRTAVPPIVQAALLGSWRLVDATVEGDSLPLPERAEGTLKVGPERLSGYDLCNSWAVDYRLEGSELRLGKDGLSTTVACVGTGDDPTSAYVRAFSASRPEIALEDGDLVVTGDDVALRFRRVLPVQAGDLAGTSWVLAATGRTGSRPHGSSRGPRPACRRHLLRLHGMRADLRDPGRRRRQGHRLRTGAGGCVRHRADGTGRDDARLPASVSSHSHSMVPGGLLVTSSVTRLTSGTSLVIRVEILASTS